MLQASTHIAVRWVCFLKAGTAQPAWLHQVTMAVKRNNCSFTTCNLFTVLSLISHLRLWPLSPLGLFSASSVGSWIYSICGPQLCSTHACTWESMCLSIMRFKMGKLILSKWQVCLSRWEGMTFLPRAASSPLDAPAKKYFNRRLMEGTQNKKKTLSSLFHVLL